MNSSCELKLKNNFTSGCALFTDSLNINKNSLFTYDIVNWENKFMSK
jgi:hypothetical protein